MKRGISPVKIVAVFIVVIVAFFLCMIVARGIVSINSVELNKWFGTIFFVLFLIVAGLGVFLVGRFIGNGRER